MEIKDFQEACDKYLLVLSGGNSHVTYPLFKKFKFKNIHMNKYSYSWHKSIGQHHFKALSFGNLYNSFKVLCREYQIRDQNRKYINYMNQ